MRGEHDLEHSPPDQDAGGHPHHPLAVSDGDLRAAAQEVAQVVGREEVPRTLPPGLTDGDGPAAASEPDP